MTTPPVRWETRIPRVPSSLLRSYAETRVDSCHPSSPYGLRRDRGFTISAKQKEILSPKGEIISAAQRQMKYPAQFVQPPLQPSGVLSDDRSRDPSLLLRSYAETRGFIICGQSPQISTTRRVDFDPPQAGFHPCAAWISIPMEKGTTFSQTSGGNQSVSEQETKSPRCGDDIAVQEPR